MYIIRKLFIHYIIKCVIGFYNSYLINANKLKDLIRDIQNV